MKTTKLIATLAALSLTVTAVMASDIITTSITTAKGQTVQLYRDSESIINGCNSDSSIESSDYSHKERTFTLYRLKQ